MPSKRIVVDGIEAELVERPKKAQYLKGPIPIPWLQRAAALPGRAPSVAIVLWYLVGVTKSKTVSLTTSKLESFGVDRYGKIRGLKALEEAGLVVVDRSTGKNPLVTILEVE